MRGLVLALSSLLLGGCSSLAFTRPGHSFDGSGHAVTALYCTNYSAQRNIFGEKYDQGPIEYGGNLLFIGFFSLLDLPLTVASDTIRFPIDLFREKQNREPWDTVNHWEFNDCENYGFFQGCTQWDMRAGRVHCS
ncbi:MAG: hypothetical protein ABNH27_14040 [Alcanivorax sp.]|jgi:uncharacterized protein YceK|uniref:hypothetical protein n=1 Tax=Alcanivorax TaxID=59753 RepID=UPI002357963D|nr:hypothetical protein [Alcanivorax jadensis]|tara:strand:+ start:682 stop:1086 length:405 start_codon:yes stop_codon:yes gene_type:complete